MRSGRLCFGLLLALAWGGFAPQAVLAAEAQPVEFKFDGRTLLGDLSLAEGRSLADGVVLLVHGTLAHKDMELIKALRTALAERGLSALAITLSLNVSRRRGMYDCATPHTHVYEDAFGEIAAWLAWLRGEGAGPVVLLGHSRGGAQVAWYMAERADSSVERVVLLAPASERSPDAPATAYEARFGPEVRALIAKARELVARGAGETLIDVPGFAFCPGGKASARSLVSYYGPEPRRDTATVLPRVKAPVQVIAGSKDEIVPDIPERIGPIAEMQGNVALEVVEGADHFFRDLYAEDAADLIANFVRQGPRQ